jgi:hypothetical protein
VRRVYQRGWKVCERERERERREREREREENRAEIKLLSRPTSDYLKFTRARPIFGEVESGTS